MRWKPTTSFLRNVARDFSDDDVVTLAGAIAFYTALSFAPLVLLLVNLGGLLGDSTRNDLLGVFSEQLGPRAGDVAEQVVEASSRKAAGAPTQWWNSAWSMVGLLVTSSAVFAQLQASLNHMWDVKATLKPRPREPRARWWAMTMAIWAWLRKRLISMGMVLVVLFILLVSLVISSIMGTAVPSDSEEALPARIIEFAASLIVAALLFAAIFKFLPDAPIAWREVWLGAFVTSLLFNVGKLALALYIDKSEVGKDYGDAVGGLIALLVWVYYSAITLLLGAEITRRLSHKTRPNVVRRVRVGVSRA